MKKLLITSMVAVAVSICAKATEISYNTTESFEERDNEGPLFERQQENAEAYAVTPGWVTTATPEDGIFTVTNIANYVGSDTHETVSRPIADTPNVKALAIDTSNPLMRTVHTDKGSTNYLNEAVFFDSVVQFTATDAKPTPGNDDKLMVWLYASDDVDNDNPGVFGETTPTTNLIITAGYNEIIGDTTKLVVTNYLTGVEIEPDSWYRLTIKSFKDEIGNVLFNVWVDGTKVVVDGVTDFSSLLDAESTLNLTGVAFDGKGAVDDLVFTTTDPFAGGGGEEPEPEPEKFTLKFTIDADAEAEAAVLLVVADGADYEPEPEPNNDAFILGVDVNSVVAKIVCGSGYKVTGATASTEEYEEGVWILPVDVTSAVAGGEITCNVAVVADSGSGDEPGTDPDPETPTVDPTSDTLSAVVAGAANANPGDIAAQVTISISDADTAAGVTDVYFKKTAVYDQAISKWVVTVALDETVVQPSADEALENVAAALTGDETTVSITYTGKAIKPGLYYGLAAAGDLTALETAVPANFERAKASGVELSAEKPEGNAGFFKVVISATNPNSVQE